MENIIELDKVTKRFGGITALNKASLQVTKGEVVGLIGDNGAGKSTLIKTLVGVYSCLLYTSPSPRDRPLSRMPSSA